MSARDWQLANLERHRQTQKAWREAHPNYSKEYKVGYREMEKVKLK